MNRLFSFSIALLMLLSSFAPVAAQQPQGRAQTPGQQQQDSSPQTSPYDDEVVRITTNLVQVDAVVTDKDGRYVTDLRPEDFEILEDGKRQEVTNFSYISTETGATVEPRTDSRAGNKSAVTVPPARLNAKDVRRTMALVVDDFCMALESLGGVRRGLKKFVDEQMQPGDLVAIMRTSSGVGALQQFTSDKRLLYEAIDRLRWFPGGRCGSSAVQRTDPLDQLAQSINPNRTESETNSTAAGIDQYNTDVFKVGMLGTINYVVRGLRELPGRKAVVLFSDGFKLINFEAIITGKDQTDSSADLREALRRLIDLSNRSSVVIYTMDARGLQPPFTAADSPAGGPMGPPSPGDFIMGNSRMLMGRSQAFFEMQDGLSYLARETGGIFIRNTNDVGRGIRRVIEDQKGYYLIGYRPDESTFNRTPGGRRRFHNLTLKVKRPGLTVRSRKGFFGTPESNAPPQKPTPAQQLIAALVSPFNSSDLNLRMTSLFGNELAGGSFMRSIIYLDASGLGFKEEEGGWRKATLDLVAVTFDGDGRTIDQITETREVRVNQDGYRRIMQQGLTYALNVPVKRPGAYQLRVAVRDSATERVGSASQFVSVPDLSKPLLSVSGIAIAGISPAQNVSALGAEQLSRTDVEPEPQYGPAARRVKQGMVLEYGYVIYNAAIDKATNRPQLTTQMRLFRDGQLIFTGKVTPVDLSQQSDLRRVVAGGRVQVGTDLTPGSYALQVIITDLLAKQKQRVVTQWADFEIVK